MRPLRLLPLLLSSVAAFPLWAPAQTIQINQQNKTIAINTTDEATATADIAAVSIGYRLFTPDAESAAAQAGEHSHAIMDALHKAGVADRSIESKTRYVGRNEQFDPKEDAAHRQQRQFRGDQSWVVRVNSQDAAAVLHLAQAAGANESGGIDWLYSSHKQLQSQAAANALIKARAVAAQMAEGLHVHLGPLIYASNEAPDVHLNFPEPKGSDKLFGVAGGIIGSVMNAPPLEIRPQTIREEATVYAVFAIE